MRELELIGVPFDGYGRVGNQARALAALREAGIAEAFGGHEVVNSGDLALPPPDPRRGANIGLINENALVAMTGALSGRVGRALCGGRFPFVYGGDCSTLLGIASGLRAAIGVAGLLFVDGHEDTMPLDVSEDGEAANVEIGLLLGLTGRLMSGPLKEGLPALEPSALALLGQRDRQWRQRFNVGSLGESGVWLRDAVEVAGDPASAARDAAAHLSLSVDRWWLHVDLDVLDPVELAAQGLPDVEDEPGGLTWNQLTELVRAAIGAGGCLGWSVVIYDPDQDPDRRGAQRIVQFVHEVARELPR